MENVENLIIEHLRHIRGRVDRIADDMHDVKHRLSHLEGGWLSVKHDIVAGDDTSVRQQRTLDRIQERLDRIEQRLELQG